MNALNMIGFAHKARFLLNQNSSVLLTGVGVVGTVGTAYLTGRASFRAAEVVNNEKSIRNLQIRLDGVDHDNLDPIILSKKEVAKLVWKGYIPAVGVGALTISAIVVAHRIDAKKIVALTVASGISERAFKEYKDKVVEKFGDREEGKVRDSVAQDRVTNNPPRTNELVLVGDGKVLCLDMLTGRYFMSTTEDLKRAENRINSNLVNFMTASLSEFFDEIGLDPTSYSDSVGWNSSQMMTLDFSTTMSTDNRPCMAVDFSPHPFPDYAKGKV